jgi:opacity protein-like surface antigen
MMQFRSHRAYLRQLQLAATVIVLIASTPALAEWSWLVGAGGGQSEVQDYSCGGCPPINSVDDTDTAYLVTAQARYTMPGASKWIPGFGIATEYVDLGELNASGPTVTDKLEASAWSLLFVPTWDVFGAFQLFAEVGVAWWQQDVTYKEVGGFQASGDFDDSDSVYGLGMGYGFGRDARIGVKVKWLRFKDVGDPDDPDLSHQYDIDLYGIVFDYRFGG